MLQLVDEVLHGVERLLLQGELVLAVGALVYEPLQDRALALEHVVVKLAGVAFAAWERVKGYFIFQFRCKGFFVSKKYIFRKVDQLTADGEVTDDGGEGPDKLGVLGVSHVGLKEEQEGNHL